MITRPITDTELKQILNCCDGFIYTDEVGKKHKFRSNPQLKLILIIQAHIGLRISDVIELKVNSFSHGEINIIEKKTSKTQCRPIPTEIILLIKDYALENGLKKTDKLFKCTTRSVQKNLKIITDYLNLNHVSTHSLRKYYGTKQYELFKDIALVQNLLNHSNSSITANYIQLQKEKIDNASKNFPIII